MISRMSFNKNWFWALSILLTSCIVTQVSSDVTFGSQPEKCQVKSVGDIMDQEEKIDCEGAMYSEIPYTSIPCNAKRINFANNNITKLTRNSFRGLQQLEEIVLSGNMISYIEAETFAGLPNLQTVNLVDNLLTEIDERPFWRAQFESMMLMVDGNPWYCDEDLKETVEAIEGKVTFIGLTCRGGFIRGIRGTIVGREFEDIRDRIENDFESWEIALIVSGCFAAVVLVALIGYTVYVCKYKNEGEEADLVQREFGLQGE
ncbi:uncharacterized protein LOC142353119 [Convolutriloba macropyga]|uniref:uncharacterized protein LOC142353119 n=1 Tax=Convolutriloba macropyga TaxID=536237 RepID=UPI003F51B35B